MYDSKATVRAPGTLLRRIGCDIIDLRIKGPAPRARRETQQVSVDTFNGECRLAFSMFDSCLTGEYQTGSARPPGVQEAREYILTAHQRPGFHEVPATKGAELRRRRPPRQLRLTDRPQGHHRPARLHELGDSDHR